VTAEVEMTKIKQAIREGRSVTLVRMTFNSPKLVEFVAQMGFDAVLIDCEHTSAGVERVEEMVRAARASGIAAIVRPEMLSDAIITRYLDCKADGIMAPHIDDVAAAERLCEIVRYARPQTWQELLLIAMIESTQAVDNLDSILKVQEIDVFFLARVDLGKSMGRGGLKNDPVVREAVDRAVSVISAAGRVPGAGGDIENVENTMRLGAKLVFVNVDDLLRYGSELYLERITTRSRPQ
jgi:2-keto-3-deoxy-L-rhamnonate aldolase RhmA